MIYLGFLLHIYQPPNQLKRVLDRIVDECYNPLFDLILKKENANFTMNLNWSLTEILMNNGHKETVDKIREALESKKLEVTGTAAYHAILPLIPKEEQIRQILINYEKNKEVLGKAYRPKGFFPPEMAFGHEIVDSIREAGYKWTITDDQPFNCIHEEVPYNYIPVMEGLPVFLRSNLWSNKISMEKHGDGRKFSGWEIIQWLMSDMYSWFGEEDGYIIIAMDGETFGHHVPGYIEYFLEQMIDAVNHYNDRIQLVHISKLLKHFKKVKKEVPPGSWSTNADDFWSGNFFPLWKNKYNASHELLWELVNLAISSVQTLQDNLDKSLNSCTFWWAGKDQEKISPITYTGIQMLLNIIKHSNPQGYERAREIEEELMRVFKDKSNLGMLNRDQVLVEMDW